MRAILTGQVGVDKSPYIQAAQELAHRNGKELKVYHVGQMMYAEAPDVPAGRILNLPINRLNALRRGVFKEILRDAEHHEHVLVNTHATFRWRHGLFAAFDFDQIKALDAELYLTLVDNVQAVHQRMLRDHELDHTLKDIIVWREEEMLATEILAKILRGYGHFFMLSRGQHDLTIQTLYRLMFEPHRRKAYLSFPMSHVGDQPQVLALIEQFKTAMHEQFICFDPSDIDEYSLHAQAVAALSEGQPSITIDTPQGELTLKTTDVAAVSGDILGQTYARDFKMIDQSDLIVSLIPQMQDGRPALSSGVERELQHAYESGKETYIIWIGSAAPSPFITETATKVFASLKEAQQYFDARQNRR